MNDFITALVKDRMAFSVPKLTMRDLDIGGLPQPALNNWVYVISGMRRSGKTYFLYQLIREILRAGVPKERVLYFNFADERLRPFGATAASEVLETFFALSPGVRKSGAYLFLDEIQEVEEWGLFLRRVVDTERVTVVVTGSSSKLLSDDIATEFRGRSLAFELLPFSFREYLRHFSAEPDFLPERDVDKDVAAAAAASASMEDVDVFAESKNNKRKAALPGAVLGTIPASQQKEIELRFVEYLRRGGFPDTLQLSPYLATGALQSYVLQTVARDIVERSSSYNLRLAETMAMEVIRRSGSDFSVNKICNDLRSRGFKVSRDTLSSLMEDFAKAHLAFRVNDYTKSAKHNPRSAYKVYAVDPGLFMAVTQATRDDIAQSLETSVYLELRRRDPVGRAGAICSYRSAQGYEVDFATSDSSMVQNISLGAAHGAAQVDKQVVAQGVSFYQACLSIENPTVRKRELRALTEAMRETGSRSAYLLTLGASEQIATDAGDVRVLPAWQWMLGA